MREFDLKYINQELLVFAVFSAAIFLRVTLPFTSQVTEVAKRTAIDNRYVARILLDDSTEPAMPDDDSNSRVGELDFISPYLQKMADDNFQQDMATLCNDMYWFYFAPNALYDRFVPAVYFCLTFVACSSLLSEVASRDRSIASLVLWSGVLLVVIPWIASMFWPTLSPIPNQILPVGYQSKISSVGWITFIGLLVFQLYASVQLTEVTGDFVAIAMEKKKRIQEENNQLACVHDDGNDYNDNDYNDNDYNDNDYNDNDYNDNDYNDNVK